MKKNLSVFIILVLLSSATLFAQTNASVDIRDDVYLLLKNAETNGLCGKLISVLPYTEKYIVGKLNEILINLDAKENSSSVETEKQIIKNYIKKFEKKPAIDLSRISFRAENDDKEKPVSFEFNDTVEGYMSSGLYSDSSKNSFGYEVWNCFNFMGDIGKHVSFKANAYFEFTKMPLEEVGEYSVGEWLYNPKEEQSPRTVKTLKNNSVLPYHYKKHWDGSVYFFEDISASGLEGWPIVNSIAFGMQGDIRASVFDDKVVLGFGRINREWAAMDTGSSLVLNANSHPFMGIDTSIHLFDWLSLSTVTGVLEFPNQDYMNDGAFYKIDEKGINVGKEDDYFFFQNAFSMALVDIDYKNLHLDFGSTCVWPKRFELGYAFPLVDRVVYQNDVGDYDNLALFGDIKYTIPSIGNTWFSLYLDEINAFTTKFWEKTRAMFAYQAGTKVAVPLLPFTTVSLRYTKVEPYCYTHHSINYTSWYDHYLSESYTNNGECIGYYLAPNSDEINLQFESRPITDTVFGLQYQLIRHGVDWGSGSVIGSNLYSELRNYDRSDLNKYFLRDGTYEWISMINLSASYDLKAHGIPVIVCLNAGYIWDWFTAIDDEPGKNTSYSKIDNEEYSGKNGVVISLGFKLFAY